mgnify:CR=1 FL=1
MCAELPALTAWRLAKAPTPCEIAAVSAMSCSNYPGEFLRELRELATRYDVPLIFDEVVTGFRTSPGGAQARFGVKPDLTTLAKILAGGLPGGAVAGRADIVGMIEHRDGDWNASRRVAHPGTFNANPAPSVITRLSDLRHVKVNHGFLEMTGHTRDAVIGRSVYEVDVLAGARNRDLAVARLNAGGTIPQMEACLDLPDGGSRFVIVAGQPIAMGDEPCMLFTFADLELRRKAEAALRQSEERFAKAFRLTPVPTLLARAEDFQVTSINESFGRVFGFGEDKVVGRSPGEIGLWVSDEQRQRFEAALARTGYVLGLEVCLRHENGVDLDCLVSAERVTINDGEFVLLVLQDITERKHTERELFDAIETVMADTSWFSRGLIEKLANLRRPGREAPGAAVPDLTLRERQILNLICSGLDDDGIARKLGLSRNTVRNHGAALYRKLGVHRRTEVILWGREHGFPLQASGS